MIFLMRLFLLHTWCPILLVMAMVLPVYGQPLISPNQTALGYGTAYTSGGAAHFYNPANLMIQTRPETYQVILGMGGIHNSNGLQIDRLDQFPEHIQPWFMPENIPETAILSRSDLDYMFEEGHRYNPKRSYEIIPFGIRWSSGSSARSVAVRSRGLSTFDMNRNWYDVRSGELTGAENGSFKRLLNDTYHVYHEVSFGFAREVTMFNRWYAGLNTLLMGVSPKIIIGGMHSEINFTSEYAATDDDWINSKQMEMRAAGDMGAFISDLLLRGNVEQAFENKLNRFSNLNVSGWGAGLDVGLTYILPLGDDLSLSPHSKEPLRKSLRFSIAFTDLGMVRYHRNSSEWHSDMAPRHYIDLPESRIYYSGQPGEVFRYLDDDPAEQSILEFMVQSDETSYNVPLPAAFHFGTAFQYDRFTSLVDLNYHYNVSAYEKAGWTASFGTEIRILRFLPLMGSVQLDPDSDISFGAGAGIDLGFMAVSGALRLIDTDYHSSGWHADCVSALGLQIRF